MHRASGVPHTNMCHHRPAYSNICASFCCCSRLLIFYLPSPCKTDLLNLPVAPISQKLS